MKRCFLILSIVLAIGNVVSGQILHTEDFNLILDTTKTIKGNLIPSVRYRNVKEKFIEIENTADISICFWRNALTIANKLEYARFGNQNIMSGGFIYVEYRRLTEKRNLVIEPYIQIQWQAIRGLDRKYAGGANLRWKIIHKPDIGFFAGIGTFYEFERWTYSGTSDSTLIPPDPEPIEVSKIRGSSYLSFKKNFSDLFSLDLSVYFQPAFNKPFDQYRMAVSSQLIYNINEHIGFSILYQNIYDPVPQVPIDKLFHDISLGLTLSF